MTENGQCVILLDFLSQLSGEGAFEQTHQDALISAGLMEKVFHLKIPFDKRCIFAGLYGVTEAPQLVAVSALNKMTREKDIAQLVTFVTKVRDEVQSKPVVKSAAQIEEEQKMAEKARIASERANAFLRNRNNAQS